MAKKPGKVDRIFAMASPIEEGADVKDFQEALNKQFEHFKIERHITADGQFGGQTMKATRQVAYMAGAGRNNLKALKRGRVTASVQRLVRGRRDKTGWEKLATKRRARYRKRLRKQSAPEPGKKVMAWARKHEGITESPAGSNWGPQIGEWIKFTGYDFPVYWCGCFACYGVVKVGGAKIPNRIRLGYTGYIVADARADTNGLTEVVFDNARAGDIAVYNFDHIGLVQSVSNGTLHAVEGNTSSGEGGSQSNGGGVFARVRNRSDVVLIARPKY